jgi:hypothetical protein
LNAGVICTSLYEKVELDSVAYRYVHPFISFLARSRESSTTAGIGAELFQLVETGPKGYIQVALKLARGAGVGQLTDISLENSPQVAPTEGS